MADITAKNNHSVFTATDLHSNKQVTDDDVKMVSLDREEIKAAVQPLRKLVKSMIEREWGVEGVLPTFPVLLSVIREGRTDRDYTAHHDDLESYMDTLIHFTSILYLNTQSLQGGQWDSILL